MDKKLKVLMVETGGFGGQWHYTCCLGNAVFEHGVDLNVVTAQRFEKPFELRFRITPFIKDNQDYARNLIQIYKILSETRPALIHVQSWLSARRDWLFLMICRKMGIPIVLTAHNLLPHDKEEREAPLMFWAFKRIYWAANAIIVHSRTNKEELMNVFEIPQTKIAVIRIGNYSFFAQHYPINGNKVRRELLKEASERRVFLIFGAMRYYKGIDLVLKAMSLLSKPGAMHLLIAGKPHGRILQDCEELSAQLGISRHVTFLPGYFNDADVAKLHAAADVLLFPYRNIFQSAALQTALAFEKPIIATSVGSFAETVTKGNAWLIEPNSPVSLAEAIEKALMSGKGQLKRMGKESLRISTEDHDWKEIGKRTKDLYMSVILKVILG